MTTTEPTIDPIQEETPTTQQEETQEVVSQEDILSAKLKEKEEIAKKAQLDYINLRMDFDMLQRQTTEKLKAGDKDNLIKIMKKILPVLDTLRTSIAHIPEEQKETPFAQGIVLTYEKINEALAGLSVFPNPGKGEVIDSEVHEVIGMKAGSEEEKGKVVEEFQKGYIYKKDDEKVIILTSKVLMGE